MEIVSTAVYVGPERLRQDPADPADRRPAPPRRDAGPGFGDALTGPLLEQLPGLATATHRDAASRSSSGCRSPTAGSAS